MKTQKDFPQIAGAEMCHEIQTIFCSGINLAVYRKVKAICDEIEDLLEMGTDSENEIIDLCEQIITLEKEKQRYFEYVGF